MELIAMALARSRSFLSLAGGRGHVRVITLTAPADDLPSGQANVGLLLDLYVLRDAVRAHTFP